MDLYSMLSVDIERCQKFVDKQMDEQDGRDLYVELTGKYDTIIKGFGNGLYQYYVEQHFYDPEISLESLRHNMRVLLSRMISYQCVSTQKSDDCTGAFTAERPCKIFVSHSSADKEYVGLFVELLNDIGLNREQIFCTSLPGYDIPIDTDICDSIREQFFKYKLHMIFIHSDNYYKSSVSLNEMGAAWALKTNCTSILLPGFEFSKMTGVVNAEKIAIKLDNAELEVKDKLNQLRDKIVEEFQLPKGSDIEWEMRRNDFLVKIKQAYNNSHMAKAVIMKRPF